jgi:hypothetical protein
VNALIDFAPGKVDPARSERVTGASSTAGGVRGLRGMGEAEQEIRGKGFTF